MAARDPTHTVAHHRPASDPGVVSPPAAFPPQRQRRPGSTAAMDPRPRDTMSDWRGTGLPPSRTSPWARTAKVTTFGQHAPMQGAAHPDDIAPSFVFFASERLSGYYSGEVLARTGGETLPG